MLILQKLDFQVFGYISQEQLIAETELLVEKLLSPKIIFFELINFLFREKIELPGYLFLSKIITLSINKFEKKLSSIVETNLTDLYKSYLDELLLKNKDSKYTLTPLKRINQSLKPGKINKNVSDMNYLYELYKKLEDLISSLGLSAKVIHYYAQTVIRSDIYDLVNRSPDKKYLYLSCFIVYQLYRQHDALVDILLKSVQSNNNTCDKQYKIQALEESKEKAEETKKLLTGYHDKLNALKEIKTIIHSKSFSNKEKVIKVQNILPLIQENNAKDELIESVEQQVDRNLSNDLDNKAPTEFLTEYEKKNLFDDKGQLNVSLYKVILFSHIANSIKSGELNLKYSYKYRSFDEYLISKELWEQDKADYLKKAELENLMDVDKTLSLLSSFLDDSYHHTNQRINAGTNKNAYFDEKGVLHVLTPKMVKNKTREISELFPDNRYISLLEILGTVNKHSNFTKAFSQWQAKYSKSELSDQTVFAAIMAYGCNLGIRKIAKISKNINEHELENVVNKYFIYDNILEANDKILELEKKLILPNYLRQHKIIHTSSDGQKYNVRKPTLNANYSFKYAGNRMACSAFEFIDNRHFLFYATVISSAEREATYVIDGLMHNTVVKSDLHSTDTHGYSEIIFATTHLLGFSYAPRIKNFKKQQLYSFKKKSEYKKLGYKILPDGYVNTDQIKKHWDDILRFICTLKLGEVTASQLFKRLSSYSKNHPLYSAIKAFGQIIKSIFILKYINNVDLRQAVTRQLNIGENSNKFSKAIFYGNNQDFIYETKEEQEIAEGCKRLIKNAIITWNYLYLSQLLTNAKDDKEKQELLKIIKNGSVETWEHLNLQGEFDFNEEKLSDSLGLKLSQILALNLDEKWETQIAS